MGRDIIYSVYILRFVVVLWGNWDGWWVGGLEFDCGREETRGRGRKTSTECEWITQMSEWKHVKELEWESKCIGDWVQSSMNKKLLLVTILVNENVWGSGWVSEWACFHSPHSFIYSLPSASCSLLHPLPPFTPSQVYTLLSRHLPSTTAKHNIASQDRLQILNFSHFWLR